MRIMWTDMGIYKHRTSKTRLTDGLDSRHSPVDSSVLLAFNA